MCRALLPHAVCPSAGRDPLAARAFDHRRQPDRGVFQTDGWGWVKTPVTYAALTKQATLGSSKAEWRVFGIFYNDDRGVLKTDDRPAAVRAKDLSGIDIGTFGGHYIQSIPTLAGTFDLLGW